MHLDYLLFDLTDDDTGAGSFDAMASVPAARLPALVGEIEAVLQWARREFGVPLPVEDGGQWDVEVQATDADDAPLPMDLDVERGQLRLPHGTSGRVTLSLTLSGSATFCDAFSQAFPAAD
ncbi:MAG: hypothetical protein ACXWC6_08685 [Ramlibacter sp.]